MNHLVWSIMGVEENRSKQVMGPNNILIFIDWLREPRAPPCNIQLQTSFLKCKSSFKNPILECVPHITLEVHGLSNILVYETCICGYVGCIYSYTNDPNTVYTDNDAISHAKWRMGAATCAHPSFGMTTTKTLRCVFSRHTLLEAQWVIQTL